MGNKFKFAGIIIAAFMSYSGLAHAGVSHINWPVKIDSFSHVIRVPANTLENCCPRPKWWSTVEAPIITTKSELLTIWQNRKLNNKIKAKVLFQAIRDFDYKDDDIVATAISLYPYVDRDYPHLIKMLEYGVGRFFNHKRSRPCGNSLGIPCELLVWYFWPWPIYLELIALKCCFFLSGLRIMSG